MPYSFDPEIEAAMAARTALFGEMVQPARGDWLALRTLLDGMMAFFAAAAPQFPEIPRTSYEITAPDGSVIALRWYHKRGAKPGPAVFYVHGGGMICGSVAVFDPLLAAYVAATGVPMLAVEYRLAPEYPHPVPVEDCFAGLAWLVANAAALGVDPARIAVMGDSAGGGLAAGVALLARDRGVDLAKQILIYPMLDDRTKVDAALVPFASWTYDNNFTGWTALLGDAAGGPSVPYAAAPARAKNLAGLAPAYIEVGELDIFRDENIEYARRIANTGISVELHVHPGAPHAFEHAAPESALARRVLADRMRVIAAL